LITPFRDNGHLTRRQRQFNTALSAVCQKVERSFSLLKGRWRKLQYLDHLDLEMAVQIITATCVLHTQHVTIACCMMIFMMGISCLVMLMVEEMMEVSYKDHQVMEQHRKGCSL